MLADMSADEFLGWQAFDRFEPFGFPWMNWALSWLAFIVDRVRPRGRRAKPLKREDFEWRAPEPLSVTRARRESRNERSTAVQRDR